MVNKVSKKSGLLFVLEKSPFPARADGISIRYNPIISKLNSFYNIDILIVNDKREKAALRAEQAKSIARNVYEFNRVKSNFLLRAIDTIWSFFRPVRSPYFILDHNSYAIADLVGRIVKEESYSCVIWVGAVTDPLSIYIDRQKKSLPNIVDWIDSPSLHSHRLLVREKNYIKKIFYKISEITYRRWEKKINASVDGSIYITSLDAKFHDMNNSKSAIIPNGVLVEDLSCAKSPHMTKKGNKIIIGFLGNMGYNPNILAARRLYTVSKQLRVNEYEFEFRIIGRSPAIEVLRMRCDDFIVTGTVDSIWEYMADVDIFVFPMESGAGLQNKILEALYIGKPVITTSICLKSFDTEEDPPVIVADTDREIIDKITYLTLNPNLRGELSRKSVEYIKNYNWEELTHKYKDYLDSIVSFPVK